MTPVALSNTASSVFTTWTYWVDPTAPLGSGGAQKHDGPARPAPMPSIPRPTVGAAPVPDEDWMTGSEAVVAGSGRPFFASFSFLVLSEGAGAELKLPSGGETSLCTEMVSMVPVEAS